MNNKPPREFWLNNLGQVFTHPAQTDETLIHVIEKSYASRLAADLAEREQQLAQVYAIAKSAQGTRDIVKEQNERLEQELADVRKDWADAERRLHDKYAGALVERDQALAMAERLAEALEGLTNAALAELKPLPSQTELGFDALAAYREWKGRE